MAVSYARLSIFKYLLSGWIVGKVTCLEQGCDGLSIALVRRVKVHDGGMSDGLGSLSAYRVSSISDHKQHLIILCF